jgi:hypothetical protein
VSLPYRGTYKHAHLAFGNKGNLEGACGEVHRALLKPNIRASQCSILKFPKIACHKIQWLQFANKNIVGLQFWPPSRHFQIPITLVIPTWHWPQLRLGKHNYMWMWIFWTKLGEEWSQKLIETLNIGCINANVIMQSSNGEYGLG